MNSDNKPWQETQHGECDCVPDIGPSHCHMCSETEDSVITWWRALELHAERGIRNARGLVDE